MPSVPTTSPATDKQVPDYYIHTTAGNFVDNHGRTLLLRGVNLSGSSKAPLDEPSYLAEPMWASGENGDATFLGRPLDVDDGSADIHLARLRGWGFNMLRFPVSWEALEHEGPGIYDYDFMDYTVRVLRKCKDYGFKVFMDPHQDVWSRFSGGSGAPFWTLHACGIDPRNFTATQGAILHSEYPMAHSAEPQTLPAMIWSTNYGRLASQTLFTLFFAGRDYAPKCIIDGVNIQDYLQSHFIAAFGALADRIAREGDLFDECVIGWDSINEPAEGFCGYNDLNTVPSEQGSTLRKGSRPTPAQSFRLGMGQAQTVDHWSFGTYGPKRDGTVTIDPKGYKMWLDSDAEQDGYNAKWGWHRHSDWILGTCIWALHGVWDIETGYVLRPDYFKCPPFDSDRPVVFEADYWLPHWRAYVSRIRSAHPEAIHFIQPPVFAQPPPLGEDQDHRGRCCYSGHYYDGFTLLTRHWNWFNADALGVLRGKYSSPWQAVKIGEKAIRTSLREQLAYLKSDADILGPYPTLIGEIGIPFDMDSKRSYGWTDGGKHAGDYSRQTRALDASLNAADGINALNYTIWTYCPDNSHQWGDGWNMEDLSLFSNDDLRRKPARNASTYTMNNPDSSSAALLRGKQSQAVLVRVSSVPPGTGPGASALSLDTIGGGSGTNSIFEGQEPDAQLRYKADFFVERPHWVNPFDFLTDGARAVRAFVRPYPVATVGVPIDINFDIGKAEFKLTIRVRPEDRPVNHPDIDLDSDSSNSREAVSELPTEIFVPLVHYAREDIVTRSAAAAAASWAEKEQSEHDVAEPPSRDEDSPVTLSSSSSTTTLPVPPPLSTSVTVPLVDVEVKVSAGRYELDGQYLRWYYPVPAPRPEQEEDLESDTPELIHTIQIRRSRGPIKVFNDGLANTTSQSGSIWDCLEKICGSDSCCVM